MGDEQYNAVICQDSAICFAGFLLTLQPVT